MELDSRYEALCLELGHLDGEIRIRKKRRKALRDELQVLKRLAVTIAKEQQNAPLPGAPDTIPTRDLNIPAAPSSTS